MNDHSLPTDAQQERFSELLEELHELSEALPGWVVNTGHTGALFAVLDSARKAVYELPTISGLPQ